MPFQNLIIYTTSSLAEALSEELTAAGALAISVENASKEALFQLEPENTPLWKKIKLVALFSETDSPACALEKVMQQLQLKETPSYEIEMIEDKDWVRITQENFPAQQFGKNLWICPGWGEIENYSGCIVRIDPGLAFGTGTHPTTSLCLQWLANHSLKDQTVLDYGCGSGILSLAALSLGANTVWAVDHDAQAIQATKQNAALNDFAPTNRFRILFPDELEPIRADIVIANILAEPLIQMAPLLIQHLKTNGMLVLSGILKEEVNRVATTYQSKLNIIDCTYQEEWALIVFHKGT